MVGDSAQAIYHWRGAKDVMTGFDGAQLTLSRSFRFGPHLAEEANRWLSIASAPIRLTGTDTRHTELGPIARPDATLCRTNVGAMKQVMELLAGGLRVALVGGGESLRSLALAARDLKEGRRTSHLFAVRAESLRRSKLTAKDREFLIHQYVREAFGADVEIPSYDTLRRVWRE